MYAVMIQGSCGYVIGDVVKTIDADYVLEMALKHDATDIYVGDRDCGEIAVDITTAEPCEDCA